MEKLQKIDIEKLHDILMECTDPTGERCIFAAAPFTPESEAIDAYKNELEDGVRPEAVEIVIEKNERYRD